MMTSCLCRNNLGPISILSILAGLVFFSCAEALKAEKVLPSNPVSGNLTRVTSFGGAVCPASISISAVWVNGTIQTKSYNETSVLATQLNSTVSSGMICQTNNIYAWNRASKKAKRRRGSQQQGTNSGGNNQAVGQPPNQTPPMRTLSTDMSDSNLLLDGSIHFKRMLSRRGLLNIDLLWFLRGNAQGAGTDMKVNMRVKDNMTESNSYGSQASISKILVNSTCADATLFKRAYGRLLNATAIVNGNLTTRRGLNITLFKSLLGADSTRAIFLSTGDRKNNTFAGCMYADGSINSGAVDVLSPALAYGLSDTVETADVDESGTETGDESTTVGSSSPSCFPGEAMVEMESGGLKRMEDVEIGDRVRDSSSGFSTVFMFTHRMGDVDSRFISLTTEDGTRVSASDGHYLYVNGGVVAAQQVRIGDRLEVVGGRGSGKVVAMRRETLKGLYNPQTTSGRIVVNGALSSCYTTRVEAVIAHGLLAPLRLLFTTTGVSTRLFE